MASTIIQHEYRSYHHRRWEIDMENVRDELECNMNRAMGVLRDSERDVPMTRDAIAQDTENGNCTDGVDGTSTSTTEQDNSPNITLFGAVDIESQNQYQDDSSSMMTAMTAVTTTTTITETTNDAIPSVVGEDWLVIVINCVMKYACIFYAIVCVVIAIIDFF